MYCVTWLLCLGAFIGLALVTTGTKTPDAAAVSLDVCNSKESFCGGTRCSGRMDNQTFVCECRQLQYFNASAQRCFHIYSCPTHSCDHSKCFDEDGYSAAICAPHVEDTHKDLHHYETWNSQQLMSNLKYDELEKDTNAKSGRREVFDDDKMQQTCTDAKTSECRTPLSWCIVKNDTEECACHPPLLWNEISGHCVPRNEYKYIVTFKERHVKIEDDLNRIDIAEQRWSEPTSATDIHDSMRTLYGKDLEDSRVINHGSRENVTVELTFSKRQPESILRMVQVCELPLRQEACFFPPTLHIVNGSVSGPVPVNLCGNYFQNISEVSKGKYSCTNDGTSEYVLSCSYGKLTSTIVQGNLKLQICLGEGNIRTAPNTAVTPDIVSIVAIGLPTIALCLSRCKRFCFA